ncbi:hypothetical protein DFH06DRAFT_1155083 [Mycena polygramma]|nr:hypothetical protein DFH06DRAFT_1155083 [Mycena polygramma]
MPIIDSSLGVFMRDPKPVKVCQWGDCPHAGIGYEDRKMKMCARCNFVRYCSKECQRADWGEHKLYCQIPPILDIGVWMEKHRPLFRWALIEALRLRNDPSKLLSYGLLVQITSMDRLVKGISPSPFLVKSTNRLSFSDMNAYAPAGTAALFPPTASYRIIEEGGIGQGVVLFKISSSQGGNSMFRPQYHDMLEIPSRQASGSATGWQNVVKGVVNGEIPISSLSRGIEAPPSRDE